MKVLVLGSGGREHALVWSLRQNSNIKTLYCFPGNGGTTPLTEPLYLNSGSVDSLVCWAKKNKIQWTVVGPENFLAEGVVDAFVSQGLSIFGVNQRAAQLESSKIFSKQLFRKYAIPTACAEIFTNLKEAKAYVEHRKQYPLVMKLDGLAQGKGVEICHSPEEAVNSLNEHISKMKGNRSILIEDYLVGDEVSYLGLCDGESFLAFPACQDHKRIGENEEGPNTGGMGAYAPLPWFSRNCEEKVRKKIVDPLLEAFKQEGIDYRGVLYIGLMISNGEPFVLELNVRFGDPEAQVLLFQQEGDILEWISKTAARKLHELSWKNEITPTVGIVMASDGYPGAYEKGFEIFGLDVKQEDTSCQVFHSGTALKDKKYVTAGGRVLCVTAKDRDFKSALKKAYDRVASIHWKSTYYRKDIGRRLC